MGQWVGSCQIIKNRVNHHLIEIIEICLKIMICGDNPTYGWVCGWMGGSEGGAISNH